MLELKEVHYTLQRDGADIPLLRDVSITFKPGHFVAIVGPSGCGKTTLLKVIAGLQFETSGNIYWRGEDLGEDGEIEPQELGYVPQFSIAYDHLTVEECVETAAKLRTRAGNDEIYEIADRVIAEVGMESMREKRVSVLSGGQKRRLGLAMELVSRPHLLLCDEVTSGLDPQSELDIVHLLHQLSLHDDRIVINVTHSLSNLDLYDSVLVMYEGHVVYHGPPEAMPHYFSVEKPEAIYACLAKRSAPDWHESWKKYNDAYYAKLDSRLRGRTAPAKAAAGEAAGTDADTPPAESPAKSAEASTHIPSGVFRQFFMLFVRRWRLFFRDRVQLLLHAALLFGFPILVVIFATDGLPAMPDQGIPDGMSLMDAAQRTIDVVEKQVSIGGLISGLVMFQVILLTLMGSNNSAREIASERLIYEKERLGGLRPMAYLASKVCFLAVLVLAQSVWMGVFVNHFTGLPGSLSDKISMLILVNGAMTAVCLAISANMKSPEQASLLSIYLVGFQLPLSGAVLALPATLEKVLQPLIAAYWSWSGQLSSMRPSVYFVGINQSVPTTVVSSTDVSSAVLMGHILCGLVVAWIGCKRHRWD
ncbi:MAG TPA: ATP-binding cassette domain-containing protein [Verrucomicrobiales bacterium]|nr:ATP-binding cassette domain-containing protein [Verrucomicrobiales bacterium]